MTKIKIVDANRKNRGIKTFFSSRTEALTGVLLSQLPDAATRRAKPFQITNVIVPNSGMQRYLELSIAEHFGICSHININYPSKFLKNCYQQILTKKQQQYIDVHQLTFAVLVLLQNSNDKLCNIFNQPTLLKILHNIHTSKQLYYLAKQIATLFIQYLNERPELISAWQKEEKLYQNPHETWQMALFNQLQLENFFGSNLQNFSQKSLLNISSALPEIHLFGFHSIPPIQLSDFNILAKQTKVNAYIFNPSVSYWRDIVPISIKAEKIIDHEDEAKLMTTGNLLLSSWGQSGKYLIEELNNGVNAPINIDENLRDNVNSVLEWVQKCIRKSDNISHNDSSFAKLQKLATKEIKQKKFSLSLHACASPRREIEILYDHLCTMFANKELEPSDVLVMAPNLCDYIPHIKAIFAAQSRVSIPFSIANQNAAEIDLDIKSFLALLNMIDNDFSSQSLFAVISENNIRRCLNLSLDDIATIYYWLSKSRTAKNYHDNSYGRAGSLEKLLDALLLATVGDNDCCVNTPYFIRTALPEYYNGNQQSLSLFCQILTILSNFTSIKTEQRNLADWRDILLALANNFLGPGNNIVSRLHQWHDNLITGDLYELIPTNELFDYETIVSDIKELLENDESHSTFLSGGIDFCTMMPMRSIPTKMICLLGLNQKFPNVVIKNPLDLRQIRPLWSDRNINKEYRYFFLETLMATRKYLYLSYIGQDDKSGQNIPPSILVDNLLGFIKKYCPNYVSAIQKKYPLQGFMAIDNNPTFQCLYKRTKKRNLNHANGYVPILPTQLKASKFANYLIKPMDLYLNCHASAKEITLPDNSLLEHDLVAVESGLDKWYFQNTILNSKLFKQDSYSQLIQHNRYPPKTISQAIFTDIDAQISPLKKVLLDFAGSNFINQDMKPQLQFIKHNFDNQVFSLLWDCPYYSDINGQLNYRISVLSKKKLMQSWVNHVFMNNVKGLQNYHTHLFTLNKYKEEVIHTVFKPLGEAREKVLTKLLALLKIFFTNPHMVILKGNITSNKIILDYKDQDYPLYPNLMKIAKTSQEINAYEVLRNINDTISKYVKNK